MYQSSAAFTELVQKDSRTFKSKLIIGENEIESGIKSIILKGVPIVEPLLLLGVASVST